MNEWHLRNSCDCFIQHLCWGTMILKKHCIRSMKFTIETLSSWYCANLSRVLENVKVSVITSHYKWFVYGWLHGKGKVKCILQYHLSCFLFSWTMSGRWKQMKSFINLTRPPRGNILCKEKASVGQIVRNSLPTKNIIITLALNISDCLQCAQFYVKCFTWIIFLIFIVTLWDKHYI